MVGFETRFVHIPLAFVMLHGTCDAELQARTFSDSSGSLTRGQLCGSTVALTMCSPSPCACCVVAKLCHCSAQRVECVVHVRREMFLLQRL